MSTNAAERARIVAAEPFHSSGSTTASGSSKGFVSSLLEIFRHRELLRLLVGRELKARYKDSSLGFLWSLIRPLMMLVIYFVAIGQVLGAAKAVPNYAIFVYAGLTVWGLFTEIISAGSTSILANGGLIKKVYLPREIFPVAAIGSALFNFAIQFAVLLAGALLTGSLRWNFDLLYAPLALAIVLVYGLAFALALSALNVYLRDVQYLVEVGLQVFFWLSPIVYAWNNIANFFDGKWYSWVEEIYLLNPVTNAVLGFQRALWGQGSETVNLGVDGNGVAIIAQPQPWPVEMPLRMILILLVGVGFVWVAHRIFRRLEGNFAQEI